MRRGRHLGKRFFLLVSIWISLFVALGGRAQITDFNITSSPSPVGSGARAMGVAGAFISIADDATAASWNPAALIQLEHPEASIVGSGTAQRRVFDDQNINDQSFGFASFNYISGSYPFHIGDMGFVFSANYQRLYDFSYHYKQNITNLILAKYPPTETFSNVTYLLDPITGLPINFTGGTPTDPSDDYWLGTVDMNYEKVTYLKQEVDQVGDVGAVAPALAAQITPKLALGLTLNFWMDGGPGPQYERTTKQWQQVFRENSTFTFQDRDHVPGYNPDVDMAVPTPGVPNTTISRMKIHEDFDLYGFNYNLGFLADVTPRFTLGGVYRSEFDMKVDRRFSYSQHQRQIVADQLILEPGVTRQHFSDHYAIHFPGHIGLGGSFRISDAWTTALDITYTDWQDFVILKKGPDVNAATGIKTGKSDVCPSVVARWGIEYIYIGQKVAVPIRAGYVYEPLPSEHGYNLYHTFAVGGGVAYNNLVLDAAYNFRMAQGIDLYYVTDADGGKIRDTQTGDFQEHVFLLSAIVHF